MKQVSCGTVCTNETTDIPNPHPGPGPGPVECCEATAVGVNCDGDPIEVTGSGVVQTVPHPEAVQLVRMCEPETRWDSQILCQPDGEQVIAIITYDPTTGVPSTAYYNLDGTPFTGDTSTLFRCPSSELQPQLMCDDGTTFIRWIAIEDGAPTGEFIDTDATGAIYTPVSPDPSVGACTIPCPPAEALGVLTSWGS